MLNKINFEILNGFVNILITNVARKYIDKLKNDKKRSPQFVETYLDSSISLLKKYSTIEISEVKNTIFDMNREEQKKFDKFFTEDKEYESLCKELNFAFLLMIDEELQTKTVSLIYDNIYEYKILLNQEVFTKKQINVENVIEKINKNKIKKLRSYNNINQTIVASL